MTAEPSHRDPSTPARGGTITDRSGDGRSAPRLTTETKSFFKTSEFLAYAGVLVGLLISGAVVDGGGDGGGFGAQDVWLYATILTVGYMVARGLAKMGVRDPYWGDSGDRNATH